jgi:hypothetical protein
LGDGSESLTFYRNFFNGKTGSFSPRTNKVPTDKEQIRSEAAALYCAASGVDLISKLLPMEEEEEELGASISPPFGPRPPPPQIKLHNRQLEFSPPACYASPTCVE